MNNAVIIIGSSRNSGNTTKIVDEIAKQNNIDVINLSDYNFTYYDYESKNRDDDFIDLMKKIVEKHDALIFATPVYWYSMSGIMKVFLDRFSDLITIEKEIGRKLRGKNMAIISNSQDDELEYDFYVSFRKTAEYLGMNYIGNKHFNADSFTINKNKKLTFNN